MKKLELDKEIRNKPTYDWYYYDENNKPQILKGASIFVRFGIPKKNEQGIFMKSGRFYNGKFNF